MRLKGSWVVLLTASILLTWNLWGWDLWAPDEPYFGEGAREMVVDGQWAVPHVNGVVTTDKPPLFFWLIALLSLPFGRVSSLTARLPSALAALGSVALTMRMGRRFAGERTGALAGMVLSTTYLFWSKGREAQIDSLLCCLILVALSCFEAFRAGDAEGRRAGLLFWGAAALAVVAKGPVGFVLPLGIALVTLAFDRNLRAWRRFAPVSGPLLFLGLVGAWALLATVGGAGEYSVWGALKEHVFKRAVEGMHHAQPPWYFLGVMPVQLLPWSGLVPGACLLAWRRRRFAEDRFLLVFAIFIVVFFSASTEKRELYVLPSVPAFALLVARLIARIGEPQGEGAGAPAEAALDRRWVSLPEVLTGAMAVLMGIALPALAPRFDRLPASATFTTGAALALAGAAAAWPALRGRAFRSALCLAGGFVGVYLVAATTLLPALEPLKSARPFAMRVKEATAESRRRGDPLLAFRIGNLTDAMSFFTDGVYMKDATMAEFKKHMERPDTVYALADALQIDALPRDLKERVVVIDEATFSRIRVLLITNRSPAQRASHEGG